MEQKDPHSTVVSSWNEWDPLKHVIVGRADGTMIQSPEIAIQRDYPEDGMPLGSFGPYPQEILPESPDARLGTRNDVWLRSCARHIAHRWK